MNENKHDRRRMILKGLAVTLPTAWTAPLVKSVVLPAHAQTSQCEAPKHCYIIEGGDRPVSFMWLGGAEARTVTTHFGTNCIGDQAGIGVVVVASSLEEAISLLPCSPQTILAFSTNPPLPEGCGFYACETS